MRAARQDHPGRMAFTELGTAATIDMTQAFGGLPTRNFLAGQFEHYENLSGTTIRETRMVANKACFACTIACGRISKIDQTHFTVTNNPKYWGATGGLEYEAAWALGAANGVGDLEALHYANMLCNEQGMDPITFGTTVGAAMELYELGLLTKEQIGEEAPFGSTLSLIHI